MIINMKPIGFAHTDVEKVPRHWSVSDVEGTLIIDKQYINGMKDIKVGQKIVVIFNFHQSRDFCSRHLVQSPPNRSDSLGVFSVCSPIRPNPIGMSILNVVRLQNNIIHVKGIDMIDGTPILDIKPHITGKHDCPSRN